MINGMTEQEFIHHPDTTSFVVQKNDFFVQYAAAHPEILMTQLLQDQYWIGYTTSEFYPNIIQALGSSYISHSPVVFGLLDRAALEASGIIQVQNQPYLSLRGQGVLIGIVDTGIDYTADLFQYPDKTSKIQFIYDQTAEGPPPEGFFFGTEYTNAQINEALRAEDPYSVVPQRDTSGHGTFLSSVAAGRATGEFIGAAPDSELIIVKLARARPFLYERLLVPPEQENAFATPEIMVGVEYLLMKAKQLNRPLVICIGLGSNYGSHDGSYVLERYLYTIANQRSVCVCTSAGNESQARHHTQGLLSSQALQQNIDLTVGEGSGSTLITVINSGVDRFSVSVRSPTGELVNRVPARSGTQQLFPLILEDATVGISYFFPMEESGAQFTIIRLINPTPGIWTITLYGDIVLDGTYHAWLPLTGFVSPGIEFLSAVPYSTIVTPATMFGSIVCGGYDNRDGSLYENSSWGPTRTPTMSPDLVAPADSVGGYFPSGYGIMSGTSVATAITAGAAALLMQWGVVNGNDPAMSTYQIRAYLLRGCTRSDSMTYPNRKWGYGTLNLLQTFNLMREM
ncbi:MAG: peptidase family protein [Oscillospiraceae bacterium]|nr:peptidase family protein [Oscillospiraceae bacterium]